MLFCWVHGRWDLRGVDFVNIGSFCSSLLRFPSFVFYFVYGSPYFLFLVLPFFDLYGPFCSFVVSVRLFVLFLHFILSFFAFIPCISFLLFSFLSAFFFWSLGILWKWCWIRSTNRSTGVVVVGIHKKMRWWKSLFDSSPLWVGQVPFWLCRWNVRCW